MSHNIKSKLTHLSSPHIQNIEKELNKIPLPNWEKNLFQIARLQAAITIRIFAGRSPPPFAPFPSGPEIEKSNL